MFIFFFENTEKYSKMTKKNLKSNRHKKLKAVDPFYIGERKLLIDKYLFFCLKIEMHVAILHFTRIFVDFTPKIN